MRKDQDSGLGFEISGITSWFKNSVCDHQLQLYHYKTAVSKGIMKFCLHSSSLQTIALEMNWRDSVCPRVLMYWQDI